MALVEAVIYGNATLEKRQKTPKPSLYLRISRNDLESFFPPTLWSHVIHSRIGERPSDYGAKRNLETAFRGYCYYDRMIGHLKSEIRNECAKGHL